MDTTTQTTQTMTAERGAELKAAGWTTMSRAGVGYFARSPGGAYYGPCATRSAACAMADRLARGTQRVAPTAGDVADADDLA